jgi:hypothetical protein
MEEKLICASSIALIADNEAIQIQTQTQLKQKKELKRRAVYQGLSLP